jgi:hypothetical protein
MEDKKLSITRVTCSGEKDFIALELSDEGFSRELLIKISLENFMMALTGRGYVPCKVKKD